MSSSSAKFVTANNGILAFILLKRDTWLLARFHANIANQALDRIINFFPYDRREPSSCGPSLNVRRLISPRLIPRESGAGRIASMESCSTRR